MPLERHAILQLGLLLMAVPLQYIVTTYMSSNTTQRTHALRNIASQTVGFRDRYMSWHYWKSWLDHLTKATLELMELAQLTKLKRKPNPKGSSAATESPAVEVLKYRSKKEGAHFARSLVPRKPRPKHVKYRIGQVIKHKKWGYRGVIIGWDEVAKAPKKWREKMHPKNKQYWKDLPNYAVLVDVRDRIDAQTTYVVEENIQVISNVKVMHPKLEEYFESHDGAQYIPLPWLKEVYPYD